MKRKYYIIIAVLVFISGFIYFYYRSHIYANYFIIPAQIEEITFVEYQGKERVEHIIPKQDWDHILEVLNNAKLEHNQLNLSTKFEQQMNRKEYVKKELNIISAKGTIIGSWAIWDYKKDEIFLNPFYDLGQKFYRVDPSLMDYLPY